MENMRKRLKDETQDLKINSDKNKTQDLKINSHKNEIEENPDNNITKKKPLEVVLKHFSGAQGSEITSLAIARDDKYVIYGSSDKSIQV